jgi:geranylgeranyl diphosphate synthase, type II
MHPAVTEYLSLIEKEIRKKKYGKQPASLYEPIRYIMALGGKRVRPLFALMAYRLFRSDVKRILPYAVALEAFHNFTLMHDDIMDNAPLRRGKKTIHEKWDVNTAILSGDVMLIKVYDMLLDIDPGKLKRVLSAFNTCAAEVCEGQQWDMEFEKKDVVTEAQYLSMIRLKTAVLIGLSLELGGILADASDADCLALREFGVNIGLGFQLKDDLLDAYADPKKFGKQVGGDIVANKKTFLLIKALEKSGSVQKRQLRSLLAMTKFNKNAKIKAVKEIYDALEIPALTEKKVNHYFSKGFSSLERLTCPKARVQQLSDFTRLLIERQS